MIFNNLGTMRPLLSAVFVAALLFAVACNPGTETSTGQQTEKDAKPKAGQETIDEKSGAKEVRVENTSSSEIATVEDGIQKIEVKIDEQGYQPNSIQLKSGVPAQITFYRVNEKNCGGKVMFKELDIKKDLPAGKKVTINFTPKKEGQFTFTCGMEMYEGTLIVTG